MFSKQEMFGKGEFGAGWISGKMIGVEVFRFEYVREADVQG